MADGHLAQAGDADFFSVSQMTGKATIIRAGIVFGHGVYDPKLHI